MLTDLLKWGARDIDPSEPDGSRSGPEPVTVSKALPRFLSALSHRPAPRLLDLGPVVGPNVEFFGDRLDCKLFIDDLFAHVDRHIRAGTLAALASSLSTHFKHQDASFDGVLCWDCFDFLDKASVQALAREVVRLVRPGGAVMGLFCTSSVARSSYTKYQVVDENTLRYRQHVGSGGARRALANRDIARMFDGLVISDSFLLKNNTREMLLRRP